MAIQFSWIISAMDTAPSEDGLTDVVKTVHWRRSATEVVEDKTYITDIYGSMGCLPPDPMAFVPYDQLTKAEVEAWLDANLDAAAMDASLTIQIANLINPPIVVLPLPWESPAAPEA